MKLRAKYSKFYVKFYVSLTERKCQSTPKITENNREQLRNFDILFVVAFYQKHCADVSDLNITQTSEWIFLGCCITYIND